MPRCRHRRASAAATGCGLFLERRGDAQRQEGGAARHRAHLGLPEPNWLETSTLSGWVGATAAALQPLIDALAGEVTASDTLHVDDTPVPVLAPGTGKTKTGRLWTYVRDERPFTGSRPPAALFFYSPDRTGEHPRAHLEEFRGVIHADGYAGFNELFVVGRITEAGCWAHVRRKFFDDHAAIGSPIAKEALDRIGQLYRVAETVNASNRRPQVHRPSDSQPSAHE